MSSPPQPSASTPRATAILAVPAPPPPSDPPPPPRKFPAPCWTHEETLALIGAYQDKWYSLRRRNLRTADWDAVAEEVTRRCPGQSPPKSSAQCRHKMEKLRKRYRTEKQRISTLQNNINYHHHHHSNNNNNNNNNRYFGSSWVLFDLIHSMELGTSSESLMNDEAVVKVDLDVKPFSMNNNHNHPNMNLNLSHSNVGGDGGNGNGNGNGNGGKKLDLGNYFDEIMLGSSSTSNKGKFQNHEFDARPHNVKFKVKNHQPSRYEYEEFDDGDEYGGGGGGGGGGGLKRKTGVTGVGEMVESIRMLGEGLVKMEKMKIEMMRDIEKMRMEMEMKRSQMILESQHLIVNAFIDGFNKSKKVKVKATETD
ncbi:hypothetical protein vseg_006429 [Gypsophila vaccaria]